MTRAQPHSGLPEGTKRFDLLNALERAKHMFGLKDIDIAYLRVALTKVRDTDFEHGSLCGFWDGVSSLADTLGVNIRALHRIEARLQMTGFISKCALPNKRRAGERGQNGKIEYLAGICLRPFIERYSDIIGAAQAQRTTQRQLKELRMEVSSLTKRVRALSNDTATELMHNVDKRLRPSEIQSVERLSVIIKGLMAILKDFDLPPSSQTKQTPVAGQTVRPYTEKQKIKNTCSLTFAQFVELVSPEFLDSLATYNCLSWKDIHLPSLDFARQIGISGTQFVRRCEEIGMIQAAICLAIVDQNARRPRDNRYHVQSAPKAFMGMAKLEGIEEGLLLSLCAELRNFIAAHEPAHG